MSRSERRPHHPLAGLFILVKEPEGDVVIHGRADIARRYSHVEGAPEALRCRRVARFFFEEIDTDRIADRFTRRVIHGLEHGFSHLRFRRFRTTAATRHQRER